jgi:hypothetical protein
MGMSESLRHWNKGGWVRADFARQLEQERDIAIEKHRLAVIHWQKDVFKMQRERDEARQAFVIATDQMVLAQCKLRGANTLAEKANELIARWDQPSWKDAAPTAGFINALRNAVEAYEQKP